MARRGDIARRPPFLPNAMERLPSVFGMGAFEEAMLQRFGDLISADLARWGIPMHCSRMPTKRPQFRVSRWGCPLCGGKSYAQFWQSLESRWSFGGLVTGWRSRCSRFGLVSSCSCNLTLSSIRRKVSPPLWEIPTNAIPLGPREGLQWSRIWRFRGGGVWGVQGVQGILWLLWRGLHVFLI